MPRPRRRRSRDPAERARLALRNIEDNLCFTDREAWAWFVLPTQPWAFRSDNQREQLLYGGGDALAWLAGHRLHLRVTTSPYPAAEWARLLDRRTPAPLMPAVGGSWGDHLVSMQQHLRHQTMAEKRVFLGVRLSYRGLEPSPRRGDLATPGRRRARSAALPRRAGHRDGRAAGSRGQGGDRTGDGVAAPAVHRPRASGAVLAVPGRVGHVGRRRPAQLHRRGRPRRGAAGQDRAGDRSRDELGDRAARGGDVGGPARGDRRTRPGSRPLARTHGPAAVPGGVVRAVRRAVRRRGAAGHPAQAAGGPRHAAALPRARPRRAARAGPPGAPGPAGRGPDEPRGRGGRRPGCTAGSGSRCPRAPRTSASSGCAR